MSNPSKKQLDKKPLWRHFVELLILIAIISAIWQWQERHLLSKQDKAQAPSQVLVGLDQKTYALPIKGQKQLVYFFAPWCTVCRLSIGNIESQKAGLLAKGYQVRYVALDWQSQAEVETFVADKELTFPVLMGSLETMQQYQIKGFPTYYLIDENGAITAGSQGYSTSFGIWLRSLAEGQ
ncbi:MAG: redoxin family protein [Gammaproteobacteria bacterium]|nr:redoxin family protein [Gammaproteobacteria bacterium]